MANTKVTGDLIASSTIATGNIADNAVTSDKISGITTAHITEGANLYYTDARARGAVSVSGNALSYNSSTGVITSNFEESPTFAGTVTASTYYKSSGTSAVLGTNSSGEVLLRPTAWNLSTGQSSFTPTLATIGTNATFAGSVIANNYISIKTASSSGSPYIDFIQNTTQKAYIQFNNGANALNFQSDNAFTFIGGSVERVRIDGSGNVGIGVTPENWATVGNTKAIQISTRGALWEAYNGVFLTNNIYFDGANKYITSQAAARLNLSSTGELQFFNAPSGTADATVPLAERIRIDSSGNVGIGQTSIPSTVLLDLKEPDAGSDLIIGLTAGTGGRAQIRSIAQANNFSAELSFYTVTGNSTSERMRITSGGTVTIGAPSSIATAAKLQLGEELYVGSSAVFQANGFVRIEHGLLIHWDSNNSQAGYLQYSGANGFSFTTEGAGSGNVGIKTTSPSHDLQIGTAATNGSYSMMIEGNFADTSLASNPRLNLIDTNFGITAGKYGSGGADDALGIFGFQGVGRGILFAHTTAGSSTHLKDMRHDMFIDGGTGDVGIGTTSPRKTLDIAASTPTLRLTNTQDPLGDGTLGTIEFFTNDSSTGANRAVSSIVCDNQAGSSVPGGELVFKTSLGGSGSPVATEKMRITDSGRVEVTGNVLSIDTVDEYREDFTTTGSSTPSFDIDLKSIGASGQPFEVFVAWTHYSTGYGAGLHQAYYQRSTIQSNITLIHTYFNQTSSNGGAWSVVWMTGTKIRVQKSSGTHGSNGYGYIRVTRLKP